ncbi:hypothetical protein KKD61_04325 [Patescibacteria group bacterium]|nr:hypothetical protein [Patescibacteria group bacterium]
MKGRLQKNNFLILLLAIVVICGAAYFLVSFSLKKNGSKEADLDQHGCNLTAGYRWCEPEQRCLGGWEDPCGEGTASAPTVLEKEMVLEKIEKELGFLIESKKQFSVKWRVLEEIISFDGQGYQYAGKAEDVLVKFNQIDGILRSENFTKKTVDYDRDLGAIDYFAYKSAATICNLRTFKVGSEDPGKLEILCALTN